MPQQYSSNGDLPPSFLRNRGFEKDNVEKVLELDTTKYQVTVILPLGYRANEQSIKLRSSFESVVEFIK